MRRVLMASGGVVLAALSYATVVPPWSMLTLGIAVGATELSPALAVLDLLWLLAYVRITRHAPRAQWRRGAVLLYLLGVVLTLSPFAQFGGTASRADAQLGSDDDPLRFAPSAMFRQTAAPGIRERVIAYPAADGSPLAMRLYRGPSSGPRPTVVVIYGGAWHTGDASQSASINRAIASHGYTVAAIDYRHAPAHRFPAQLEDVRGALTLLHDSSSAWSIDTTRLVLLGRSSGGQLAELAAYTQAERPVRAVIAIYAPYDLTQGYEDVPRPDPIGIRSVLRDFIGGTPAEQRERYRAASPATFVRAGLPPTLLLYGGRDHVVKPAFNRRAADALRAAHVPVVQVEVPWADHGFDMAPGGLGAQLELGVVLRFLARWTASYTVAARR
jgi:acetyl esterase/lipase